MIPNVNPRGQSFKGVSAYLLHDKNKAQTSERVAWSSTHNLYTDDIEKASNYMAWTDKNKDEIKTLNGNFNRGAQANSGNVYHYSLSWSPDETKTREEMEKAAHSSVKQIGLNEHQYYLVAHNDEPHEHVHIVVNLVHPESGLIKQPYNDFKVLDKWSHEYELENGIVCKDRDKKYKAWEQEKNAFKEKENREEYAEKVTCAFQQSDNSKSFKSALEHEGLTLAKGNRRSFVLVDRQGEIYALNRLITFDNDLKRKEKNAAINEKLEGIDKASLPIASELQEQRQTIDRDAEELKQQKSLADAAQAAAEKKAQAEDSAKKKVIEIERLEKKYFQEKRTEIFSTAKMDWQAIKIRQVKEKQDLTQKLRNTDSQKEEFHRKHWDIILNQEKNHKDELQNNLNQKGFSGFIFKVRSGKVAKEEITAINKNIENATMRLNEGIGGLNAKDRYILAMQGKTQQRQRAELKNSIDEKLKQAKVSSREKADEKYQNAIFSDRENIKVNIGNDFNKSKGNTMNDDIKPSVFTDGVKEVNEYNTTDEQDVSAQDKMESGIAEEEHDKRIEGFLNKKIETVDLFKGKNTVTAEEMENIRAAYDQNNVDAANILMGENQQSTEQEEKVQGGWFSNQDNEQEKARGGWFSGKGEELDKDEGLER